jgi:AraC-like DNA-binding protein/mannose-6-phosphate isomerase-like protein (cupin superfamily)
MPIGKITQIKMPSLGAFDLQIKYTETDRRHHSHEIEMHTHSEFELYINLSGEVSFLVEDALYPLSRGDVIIARPGEHHHCVYRGDAPHKLFWILFDSQKNADFWDFTKDGFPENFISPRDDLREELISLCYSLHGGEQTEEEKLYTLLRFFAILKQSRDASKPTEMPEDVSAIVEYIHAHIGEELSVSDLAEVFYISKSTLERRLKETLDMTPREFMIRKKMIVAAEILKSGASVLDAGTAIGYRDNSYFISLFRRYYNTTPYRYKKESGK